MTMKTTRWRPDTCACDLEYEWDDALSPDVRTHVGTVIHRACTDHALLLVPAVHHAAVQDENQRKNGVLSLAVASLTRVSEERTGEDGVLYRALKPAVSYAWAFSASRVLRVSFSGVTLPSPDKNTLQALADTRFGLGRVIVE